MIACEFIMIMRYVDHCCIKDCIIRKLISTFFLQLTYPKYPKHPYSICLNDEVSSMQMIELQKGMVFSFHKFYNQYSGSLNTSYHVC